MPLYEYECQACGRRFEKIRKFSDPELTECPHCSGRLERLLHAPAVQFAGSGWYKDLYSSAKPAASSTEGKPAASGNGAGSAATSGNGSAAGSGPAPAAPASAAPAAGGSK